MYFPIHDVVYFVTQETLSLFLNEIKLQEGVNYIHNNIYTSIDY